MKLKIERLRDFERDPSNNFLTRSEMMEAVKELIALREAQKGEQVPVAWIRERIIDKPEHKGKVWRDISYPAKPEPAVVDGVYHDVIIPLYDRPQKLVVRPRLEPCLKQVQFERDCEWIEAIEAAGGIVDSE